MSEIGLGHNQGPELWTSNKPIRQLDPASPSILDMPPAEVKERRRLEVQALLEQGRGRCRMADACCVGVSDHHKRVNVWGQSRCHLGTADDLTTVAKHDDLSNHLFIADDPLLRAFGMAEYLAEASEVDDEDELSASAKISSADYAPVDDIEVEDNLEEEPELAAALAPGVIYSTDSPLHAANTKPYRGPMVAAKRDE